MTSTYYPWALAGWRLALALWRCILRPQSESIEVDSIYAYGNWSKKELTVVVCTTLHVEVRARDRLDEYLLGDAEQISGSAQATRVLSDNKNGQDPRRPWFYSSC